MLDASEELEEAETGAEELEAEIEVLEDEIVELKDEIVEELVEELEELEDAITEEELEDEIIEELEDEITEELEELEEGFAEELEDSAEELEDEAKELLRLDDDCALDDCDSERLLLLETEELGDVEASVVKELLGRLIEEELVKLELLVDWKELDETADDEDEDFVEVLLELVTFPKVEDETLEDEDNVERSLLAGVFWPRDLEEDEVDDIACEDEEDEEVDWQTPKLA